MEYRAKKYTLLNDKTRTTRTIYTPQVLFKGEWCCFEDESTISGIIEHENKVDALKDAKRLADS